MNQKESGMLHFDVSLGCTAEVLIGALAELLGDVSCVKQGLEACKILDIQPVLKNELTKNISGKLLDFETEHGASLRRTVPTFDLRNGLPKSTTRHRPLWARSKKSKIEASSNTEPTHENSDFDAWMRNEPASLLEVRRIIEHSSLFAIPKAFALKTIDLLITTLGEAISHDGAQATLQACDGARILCEIIAFSQMLSALDPLSVSATRVSLSTPIEQTAASEVSITNSSWVLALSESIPTLDRNWPAPYSDAVGLALLRCAASRFGARGESVLLRHGVGLSLQLAEPRLSAKALWCVPTPIFSRADLSKSEFTPPLPSVEVCATLPHGIDTADLLRRLTAMGMKSVMTWQALEVSTYPRLMIRGIMPYPESHRAVEALLVTGEALEVTTNSIETQSLQQRVVSVPYGQGQKMQTCKITEWLWSGKILRADPDASDLSSLAKSTGFAQEVVRADVLAAWRKWRQT